MNRIYRTIYNASQGVMQVVSELANARTKSPKIKHHLLLSCLIVLLALNPVVTFAAAGDFTSGGGKGGDNIIESHGLGGQGGVAGGGGGSGGNNTAGNGGNGATQDEDAQPGVTLGGNNSAGGIAGPVSDLSFGGGGGGSGGNIPAGETGGDGGKGTVTDTLISNSGVISGSVGGSAASGGGGGGGGALVLTGSSINFTNTTEGSIQGGTGGSFIIYEPQLFANGGGGGGSGITLMATGTITNQGSILGGTGGTVEYSFGGNGGAGVFLFDSGSLKNESNATITGGSGGQSTTRYNHADGGAGVLSNRGTITNSGTITGGAAVPTDSNALSGTAGDGIRANGSTITNNSVIKGGDGKFAGGNGVSLMNNGGAILTNQGTISGGTGTTDGAGVFIDSDDNTLINAGAINGGGSANAVTLAGSDNTLELREGYSFTGNVVASGSNNTLALGGSDNAAFAVDAAQFSSLFNRYEKTGSSLWTLTGTKNALTPWTLSGGTLSISEGASLGNANSAVTFADGTLQTTATTSLSQAIALNTAGTLEVATGTTLTDSGTITGSGSLTKTGAGTLVFSNAKDYTGSTTVSGGILQTDAANALLSSRSVTIGNGTTLKMNNQAQQLNNLSGAGTLALGSGALTANNSSATTLAGTITGSGSLTKTGTGTLTLSSANSYTGATTVNGGTLILTADQALNNQATLTVADGTTLQNNSGSQSAGALVNDGTVAINAGTLNVQGVSGNGSIDLGSTASTLNIASSSGFTLSNKLTGNGRLNLSANGGAVTLAEPADSAFTGTVNLSNAAFALNGTNTRALTAATLETSVGSVTTVGISGSASTQTVGNLDINGGTLNFYGGASQTQAESIIATGTLTATTGTINLVGGSSWINSVPSLPGTLSVLEQNRGNTVMQLVRATSASGAEDLTLTIDNKSIAAGTEKPSTITQNGQDVAKGIYNYGLFDSNSNAQAGIYMNYGLVSLDLLLDNGNALKIATDAKEDANRELTTQLTGVGGVVFDATNGALTVANEKNSYTGTTTVTGGEVLLGENNSFGKTSLLTVNQNAKFDLAKNSQELKQLDNKGVIDLAGGRLTLTENSNSSSVDGLTGSGTLEVNGGTLTLSATNSGLTAATNIATGAAITLTDTGTLGTSVVAVDGALNLNHAITLTNVLSGSGQVNINENATLSGTSTFSGTHNIAADKALTVSKATNLGANTSTVNLGTATSQLIFNKVEGPVAQTLTGNGIVTVNDAPAMSLSGDNSAFTGQVNITNNSTLSVSDNNNLGSSNVGVAIDANSTLAFDHLDGALSHELTGTGTWSVTKGSKVTLAEDNTNALNFNGTISINGGSTLSLGSADRLNADATVAIVTTSDTLSITNAGDFSFDHLLRGSGVLDINTNNNTFNFGNHVGDGFTGTVKLTDTVFLLNGNNTTGNTNTTLELSRDSSTSVADGVQKIGHLTMSGGTLIFNHITEANGIFTSQGTIEADGIDTTGGGTVQVDLPAGIEPNLAGVSILALDSGYHIVDLITTSPGKALGVGENLDLVDGEGNTLESERTQQVFNTGSSSVAANGSFKFDLTTGDEHDGLYVAYILKKLELLSTDNEALALVGAANLNGTAANEMKAQVTGSGDLAITQEGTGAVVVISGAENTYTGQTLVHSGTLQLGADQALGNTSNLVIDSGASTDLNGHSQTVVALNSASGSTLDMGEGSLTVSSGGTAAGAITGAGNLILTANTLTFSNNNASFTGTTTIDSGATADVTQNNGLGTGVIAVAGTLHLNGTGGGLNAATLSNALKGSGTTTLSDAANVTLSGDNSEYSGTFTTASGTTLTAGSANNLGEASVANSGGVVLDTNDDWQLTTAISGSGTLRKEGDGTVTINGDQVSASTITVAEGALLIGNASVSTTDSARASILAATSTGTLTGNVIVESNGATGGDGEIIGNVTNSGNILVGKAATGGDYSDFTINGNYVGNGGNVTINSALGDDNSATDRLVITGNTSGTSTVTVNNIGGSGGKNINGIEIIDVGGSSNGTFTLNGRAQAGVLEYFLYQGTPTEADGNWYLRSNYADRQFVFTPEAGSMLGNLGAAQTLFNTRLDDLLQGRAPVDEAPSGIASGELRDGEGRSSLWLRQVRSRTKSQDATGQLDMTSNNYVAQLGGEVFDTTLNGTDRLGLGLMAGYGRASSNSRSSATGYRADSKLTGYNVGVYGTWYANDAARYSPYLHSWLRYDWFNTSGSGSDYRVKGLNASVEGGYPFSLHQSEKNQTYIIPQVQLALNGNRMNDQENGGVAIQQTGKNNIRTRLGARLLNDTQLGKGTSSTLTTYLDVSWLQDSRQTGISAEGQRVQQAGNGHALEVRVGAQGNVTRNLRLWATLAQQMGPHGYDDKAASLGVKYNF